MRGKLNFPCNNLSISEIYHQKIYISIRLLNNIFSDNIKKVLLTQVNNNIICLTGGEIL
jgi:hypothetical protein